MNRKKGVFYGVGVGPGDPELLTRKAVRVLADCDVIAAPRTKGETTLALEIAGKAVDLSGKQILPLEFTMDRDPEVRMAAYRAAAERLKAPLDEGRDVAMVTLGDVSIYTTYCYLMDLVRADGYEVEMVPGVTSFSAIAARLGISLTEMDAPLHIIPASAMSTRDALALDGTKVLMKSGRQLDEVVRAIEAQGLLERASLVSNCGLENELVCTDLSQLREPLGYFTTIIVK